MNEDPEVEISKQSQTISSGGKKLSVEIYEASLEASRLDPQY